MQNRVFFKLSVVTQILRWKEQEGSLYQWPANGIPEESWSPSECYQGLLRNIGKGDNSQLRDPSNHIQTGPEIKRVVGGTSKRFWVTASFSLTPMDSSSCLAVQQCMRRFIPPQFHTWWTNFSQRWLAQHRRTAQIFLNCSVPTSHVSQQ